MHWLSPLSVTPISMKAKVCEIWPSMSFLFLISILATDPNLKDKSFGKTHNYIKFFILREPLLQIILGDIRKQITDKQPLAPHLLDCHLKDNKSVLKYNLFALKSLD